MATSDQRAGEGFYVRVVCGAWHPTLRQPWGSAPSCKLDMGHPGWHYAMHVGDAGREHVAW